MSWFPSAQRDGILKCRTLVPRSRLLPIRSLGLLSAFSETFSVFRGCVSRSNQRAFQGKQSVLVPNCLVSRFDSALKKSGVFSEWKACPRVITGCWSLSGYRLVHADSGSMSISNSADGTSGSSEKSVADAGNGEETKKRKKLKGKRAVVRWLKFFRWKKKKEYLRMTAEEKILFKLTKARKKEERLVVALKKIEPTDTSETVHDPEILTPEEHFFFLKMGLKCRNYVPIGRRGISKGVILNMHLHWKKHQTLQVIVKTFSPEEVKEIAVELARLSGGIVLDIHEKNTIIMYRGKNYAQPPTEIMSPRVTLSRRKALEKSKFRDGLRAVRKHMPKLEQELLLIQSQAKFRHERNSGSVDLVPGTDVNNISFDASSRFQLPNSGEQDEHKNRNMDWDKDVSLMDSDMASDSEDLSDIFETESDSETDEKVERSLYLDQFDKFPVETDGEPEDLRDHLRKISADSKKSKLFENTADSPAFDEVDKIFLRAASLLKRRQR